MRSHAKASSAAPTERQAKSLGRIVRGAFAGRGASGDADGSGAPSARGRLALASLAALALTGLVLVVASAFAAKEVIDYIGVDDGTSVDLGEEFSNPRDVAVNRSGAGPAGQGDIYVADQSFDRIQRFDAEGNFVAAWGANVVTEAVNEEQTLSVEATGGTYVLSFAGEETAALAYDASSTTVRNALRALSAIGSPNVNVSGSAEAGYTIEFRSALAATNVAQVTVDDSNLSGAASTGHPQQGFGAYEICTVAANCIEGTATGNPNFNDDAKNGALDDPQSVAVDNDTGNVYVSDRDNRRVNVYDGVGTFIRSFGWDVTASGPGETGTEYEICEAEDGDVCKQGVGSSSPGLGQFHTSTTSGAYGIAVSPRDGEAATGKVFLANSGDEHVNTYDLDGANPGEFGSSATFGSNDPRNIAVDSRGVVYASNSSGGAEIERYDSENANGEGVGFLEPIVPYANETQKVHFASFSGGDTFTLGNLPVSCSSATTDPIEYTGNATTGRENMQAALEAKCGTGNFSLASGPANPVVTFEGEFAGTDVPTMSCTTESGSGTCEITDNVNGAAGALPPGSSTATAGLAVDPDTDEGGADTDVLYVLRDPSSGATVVQQFGPTNEPGLTAAPTKADDTHGEGAGFGSVQGFGLDDESGRLFVSASSGVSGLDGTDRVYILDEITAPAAALDPVTEFDAHSATFTGEANPNGNQTRYRFEYVDDAEFQANGFENAERFPPSDVDLGAGTSSIPVEAELPHHLVPGTEYHVRLLASQVFTATKTSSEQTFTTPGVTPTIHTAATAGTEEATLRAAINPEGSEVGNYHFNWGTSESYGNTTPVGTIPPGAEPVAVEEELSGLTPGQTYHYRLVATNETGTTEGPDQTFTVITPPQFPQRGYEIASDYPTGSVPIIEVTGRTNASEDGDRVAVSAPNPLAHSTLPPLPDQPFSSSASPMQYLFSRGSDSWQRTEVGLLGVGWSADVQRFLATSLASAAGSGHSYEDPRVDPDDQNGRKDVYQWQPDGKLTWISRDPRIPVGTPQTALGDASVSGGGVGQFAMSADGHTVLFRTDRQLLDADTTPGNASRLYKWQNGQLSFIGKRPDGSVPANGSGMGSGPNQVSRNGDRVVWRARRDDSTITSPTLYIQRDGEPTVEAVKETGVPTLPASQPYNVTYRGAAADDSRVFFTSSSRLTPDSGASATSGGSANSDLYVYDLAADKVRDLTPRLDGLEDQSIDPATADRARVLGVAANSEDGSVIYFVADGQLDTAPNSEGELPSAAGRNLYLAELDGIEDPVRLHFIASLGVHDSGDWQQSWDQSTNIPAAVPEEKPYFNEGKMALASPDGSVLGFASLESLTGQPLGNDEQLFVYEADTGRLACASCTSDGSLPASYVNKFIRVGDEEGASWQGDLGVKRWVSSDGAAFFATETPLVPADENIVSDVYEYRGGQVHLITPGTANNSAILSNASVDGGTVFFTTQQALVPQDKEPGVPKLYAARVGGGFPYVAPPPPCDFNAGACEGAPSTAPNVPGAGTAAFEGPGNPKPKRVRRCPKGKRKVHRKGKVRCVKRRHKKRHHKKRHHKKRHHKKRHHKKRTANHNRRASR